MNPRLALVAVLAMIVVLVFVGYLLERRRTTRKRELDDLREQVRLLEAVVQEVGAVAADGQGLDITAERVAQQIRKYERVRLAHLAAIAERDRG